VGKPRFRSGKYLKWVRALPCALTGYTQEIDAAHIRMHSGTAITPPDNHAIPLRHALHMAEHHFGPGFWPRATNGLWRDEVIEFAEALHQIYPNEEVAMIHLETMQRRVNVPFIVEILS
jgi:hypothetical protein